MSTDTLAAITNVYLAADPEPIATTDTVEQVADRILQAKTHELQPGNLAFVRLPMAWDDEPAGDALVRPDAIVAIVPARPADEDA